MDGTAIFVNGLLSGIASSSDESDSLFLSTSSVPLSSPVPAFSWTLALSSQSSFEGFETVTGGPFALDLAPVFRVLLVVVAEAFADDFEDCFAIMGFGPKKKKGQLASKKVHGPA
jgi:hypothetical protein